MPRKQTSRTQPQPVRSKREPIDGLTAEVRDRPYTDDPALLALEERFASSTPDQLPLFVPGPAGSFSPALGGLPPLTAHSSLELAGPGTGESSSKRDDRRTPSSPIATTWSCWRN